MLAEPIAAKTLGQERQVELIVNEMGVAVLLHKGPLPYDYLWVQYDDIANRLQLITEEGVIQEFGLVIPPPLKSMLKKAQDINLVEVSPDMSCRMLTLKSLINVHYN
jgi:hypothetical protein